jgi:hypothetical protein
MIKSKLLSDSAWKDVLAKNKGVKDNGLLKSLAEIKKLGDDDHDDAQDILDQIQKLAGQLKKSKEIAAVPAVAKFLAELTGAADTAVRDVEKAKAEADKAAKAKAEADKKAQADAAKKGESEAEDDEDPSGLLTTKLKPLLRQVAKGETMHALVAKSGKQVVVMLSRKPIPPARRKMLADELGGGSTKYYPGHCELEAGATTFVLKAEVAGMSKLIKAALLEQTGLRINKIKCRGEDGDDDDGDGAGDLENMTSPDGDEPPDFVPGVEIAADDKKGDEPPDFVPGVEVPADDKKGDDANADRDKPRESVPEVEVKAYAPQLDKAPQVWKGTRQLLQANIDTLTDAIRAQLADEEGDMVQEVNDQLLKLNRIMDKLDKRLTNSLTNALDTNDAAVRSEALQTSKGILAEYIQYVKSEPLIEHLDSNPFGVKMDLKATLTKSLTVLARAIG